MDNTCGNCGQTIAVSIFRGSGACSVDCRKALGLDFDDGSTMMLVSTREREQIEASREARQRETTGGRHD